MWSLPQLGSSFQGAQPSQPRSLAPPAPATKNSTNCSEDGVSEASNPGLIEGAVGVGGRRTERPQGERRAEQGRRSWGAARTSRRPSSAAPSSRPGLLIQRESSRPQGCRAGRGPLPPPPLPHALSWSHLLPAPAVWTWSTPRSMWPRAGACPTWACGRRTSASTAVPSSAGSPPRTPRAASSQTPAASR